MSDDSGEVLEELCSVLKEKTIYDNAVVQSHSVGLELNGITIDIVPVVEHESYKEVYYVGSSEDSSWTITDPKGHKVWSTSVNQEHRGEYKPLVKIFKWWRRTNCPEDVKYPKGITLEKLIADNIGDSSLSTEDFLIDTMQNIVNNYESYLADETLPYLDDPSQYIFDNDLLSGYEFSDFKAFVEKIEEHLKKLNDGGTSNEIWKSILGDNFPSSSANSLSTESFNSFLTVQHRRKPVWPMVRSGAVFVTATVEDWYGNVTNYENNSYAIEKHCKIVYKAHYNSCRRYRIVWQIVNTGIEAQRVSCLRGGFESSNIGIDGRKETTEYTGKHYVQCFVIDRNGNCVAKSKEFFINVV